MRTALTILLSAALSALVAPWAAGQTGSLVGSVRTSEGQPVPTIVLTLTGPAGSRQLVTGPEGRYRVTGLAAGEYALSVSAPGFVLSPEPRVTVGADVAHLDLVLGPAPVREQVVVTATRGEAPVSSVGNSVDAWDRERIEERAPSTFLQILQETPGVATARSGGVGLQSSAFVRGGESRFARFLVDGVPVNQPGGAFDLGSLLPLELERVEVVRGAASSLYGTDALAGVVQVFTRRAAPGDALGLRAEGEGGSFDWWRYQGGVSGSAGKVDWSGGIVRLTTDNEEPNSRFEETAGAASLGVRFDDRNRLRFLVRGEDSTAGTPGQTAFNRPDLDASFERNDVVLGAEFRHTRTRISHELRAGYARTDQLSLDPLDSGSYTPAYGGAVGFPLSDFTNPEGYQNRTARFSAAYQAEAQVGTRHLLTAGVEVEHETGELGDRREELLEPSRTNGGFYAQDRVLIGSRANLTVGGRVERNGSFGWKAVPRAALAVRLVDGKNATTLRASAGAGIKEPSFFESYGVSFYAKGNPDLKPERSRTYDAGLEQRLFGGRARASATWFRHDYLDQIAFEVIDFETFEGTYTNLDHTRGQGLELAVEARPAPWLTFAGDYTLLDGTILASSRSFDPVYAEGNALLRRPKHQGTLSARVGNGRVSGGLTWVAVGERADSDFVGLGLTTNPGYSRVDARLSVRIGARLQAFAVGENLFDESYQEVLGYPALGRALRAGAAAAVGLAAVKTWLAWSSGKDSAWSLHLLRRDPAVAVAGLLTTMSAPRDRVAMHDVRRELVQAQAEAVGLPLQVVALPDPCSNEAYEDAMRGALAEARRQGVEAIAFGDLFLEDIRRYREAQMAGTGLLPLFPLWGRPTAILAREMVAGGLRARLTCVDPRGLPASFAGREFDASLLDDLPPGVDPCGENGEFHTFAWDGPMFSRPVPVAAGKVVERGGFVYADLGSPVVPA